MGPIALCASVALHAASLAVAIEWARATLPPVGRGTPWIEIDLSAEYAASPGSRSASADASRVRDDAPRAPELSRDGSPRPPEPDTRFAGRGGSRKSEEPALRLSDTVDGLTLVADAALFTEQNQLSRLRTDLERASSDDRRTTPNPMQLTFVLGGTGTRLARLPRSTDSAPGGIVGEAPAEPHVRSEPPSADAIFASTVLPAPRQPDSRKTPPRGIRSTKVHAENERSGDVAPARPAVRQSRASVEATERARPADTVDSALEVASVSPALLTASTAGAERGPGIGGTQGAPSPGDGGRSGPGFVTIPSGDGGTDHTLLPLGVESYAEAVTRKVYPLWEDAFPMWARVQGRSGIAVIGVTFRRDGSVRDVHLVRGSGIAEFDRNVARALERGAPYGLLPRAVRDTGLTLHIAFDATNPAVGRSGPGPGRR